MVFEAQMLHGEPIFADHTATADIAAGEVVLIANTVMCGIAHLPIVNTALGSLAVGGGIYDVKVVSNYAKGTKVWWDNSLNACTTTSTNNTPFGWTVEASAAANTIVEVLHQMF